MSLDGGMDKEDVVHIYNGILLNHLKQEQINAICSDMDGPSRIIISDIIQYHLYMESKDNGFTCTIFFRFHVQVILYNITYYYT